jgi:uncharacterized protein (UPF0333 family)
MEGKAQASPELLIILAAILAMVVLAVVFFLQPPEQNYESRYTASKIYWNNQKSIAITDAKAIKDGLILFLKNAAPRKLSINSIYAKDQLAQSGNRTNFTDNPIVLEPGMYSKVTIPMTYGDTSKRKFVALEMKFDYSTEVDKSLIGAEDLIIPSPSTCNENSEACHSDMDCCGGGGGGQPPGLPPAICKYNKCGGCGETGQNCTADSDCCSPGICYTLPSGGKVCKQKSDLAPLQLSPISPDTMKPTDFVSLRVINLGEGPAVLTSTMLEWTGTGCSPCIDKIPTPSLEPGEKFDFYSKFACMDASTISLIADIDGVTTESSEGNNALQVSVSCPLSDLSAEASGAALGAQHIVGSPFNVDAVTSNIGAGESDSSLTIAAFDGGTVDGLQSLNIQVPPLQPSFSSPPSNLTLRCSIPGTRNLTLIADGYHSVPESDELNSRTYSIECLPTPQPDLIAFSNNTPISIYSGQAYNLTTITQNMGNLASMNQSITRVIWGGAAIANTSVLSLQPGTNQTATVLLSCNSSGIKDLTLIADADGHVSESDESNNITYQIRCSCTPCSYSHNYAFGTGDQNWLPYLSGQLNMVAVPEASITAIWFNNIRLDDYGQIYLNNQLAFHDYRPGPAYRPGGTYCGAPYAYQIPGPAYVNPSAINQAYGATNVLHFDNVDWCSGQVGYDLNISFNYSYVPPTGSACECWGGGGMQYVTLSPLYHGPSCPAPSEYSTSCPSGICSWDPGNYSCTTCKAFPSACSSNSECCNNLCENYNGTMRCAYSPHLYNWGACTAPNYPYIRKNGLCVPSCNTNADCAPPLVCTNYPSGTTKGCRLPCTSGPQCGNFTTECLGGYCKYTNLN